MNLPEGVGALGLAEAIVDNRRPVRVQLRGWYGRVRDELASIE
jgi:hypothetical protein